MLFTSLLASLAIAATTVSAQCANCPLAKVYSSCVGDKQVALTFDDGPFIWDGQLAETLAKYNAKASFFVNVKNWGCSYDDARIGYMRSMFKAGHEYGSHSYSHQNMSTLTWDTMHQELSKTELLLNRVLGVQPALFRPPFGARNDLLLKAAAARNQSVILWDTDSEDSLGRTPEQSIDIYQKKVTAKAKNLLVLNHDVVCSTVHQVLPEALRILSAAGYKFVTVSQCLGIKPYQWTKAQGVKNPSTWVC